MVSVAKITDLIDKQDTFEIIRDQIGAILLVEMTNQVALAAAEPDKDADDWRFEVYVERSDAFSVLRNDEEEKALVHVWFDRYSAPEDRGNTFQRQGMVGYFNIDVVANGLNVDITSGGQERADHRAFLNAQRVMRLVRNIIMHPDYRYLDLRGTVSDRWVDEVEAYRVEPDKPQQAPNIAGIRIRFKVRFNEFAPQVSLETLEEIGIRVLREGDGKLLLESEIR